MYANPAKESQDDDLPELQGVKDADVLKEARERYQRATAYHERNVQSYRSAMDFLAGNQWDDRLKRIREARQRPVLVMDRLTTHVNQVVNDQRQNKPAIKVHPVDDRADVKTAEIYDGVIRSIERQSNAPMVYETASWTQVGAGQGAWRVLTKYADEASFEQELFLQRILDPTSVVFDPDATEQDGSDAKYAFVVTAMTREAFQAEYPDVDPADWAAASDPAGWWDKDSVRCAEYFRIVYKPTTFYLLADGSTLDQKRFDELSEAPKVDDPMNPWQPPAVVKKRQGKVREVQWFKLGGNTVIEKRLWPGIWIPLVRVIGNEIVSDGRIIYTGLTQRSMDAQRLVNYQTSVVVEMLSLQKTAPFIAAKGQITGSNSKRWANANSENPVVLEYEPISVDGVIVPAPQRQSAPTVPTGNVEAMRQAADDLQWITGQHSASFGAPSNETSGRAINARARESDTATYQYIDNLSRGILHTARILIDLIPKVYDTQRVLRILGEDDTAKTVLNDPNQQQAVVEVRDEQNAIQRIYNLGVGRYDVSVTVGPSYGTKRIEAVEAMTQLLQGNPAMWNAVGDLFIKNQDWPGAQQMAERLRKMVPPQLLGEEESGADPMAQITQLQATLQQMQMALEQRTMQLQQYEQVAQKAGEEIDRLRNEQNQAKAQVQDKTQAAAINAQSEAIRAEADVRIAEITRETELAKAAQASAQQEIGQLQQSIGAITAQLAEIAAAALAKPEDAEKPTTKTVQFSRGPDGRIAGAVIVEQEAA